MSGQFDLVVPDVKNFIRKFNSKLRSCDTYEIQNLYDIEFQKLTERFFKGSPWPSAEAVKAADIVDNDDENFLVLYKELYFRHIYSKLSPTVINRFDSFINYTCLFNILLGLNSQSPELELPTSWLWDILDEFIYQFRTFHQMRAQAGLNTGSISAGDIQKLKEAPHLWSAQTVTAYLDRMVKKGGEEGVHPFFKSLRQYSLIAMARVLCLMSDYYGALEMADDIDMDYVRSSKNLIPLSSLSYYCGFSYMMLRRYADAVGVLSEFLIYARRRRLGEGSVGKRVMQINGIIAMCQALNPQDLEDGVATSVREKYGDKLSKMRHNDYVAFEDLFDESAPKFVSPSVPDYGGASVNEEACKVQKKRFISEVRHLLDGSDLHDLLKMCTTISTGDLSRLAKKQEKTLVADLLSTKIKSKCQTRTGASLSEGACQLSATAPFYIKDHIIHVAQSTKTSRHGDYFMGQILQYDEMQVDAQQLGRN